MVGQAGAAARTIRRDAVVLNEEALVVDLLERPPDALDVVGIHGPVGAVEIDPVAHAPGHCGEFVDMAKDGLAAALIERCDAVPFDVLLTGEAEFLLDGQLDREAVAVPACLPRNVETLHRAVAGEHVLEDASFDVMGAGSAVGRRGTLVEHPGRLARALRDRFLEYLLCIPQIEHVMLHRRQVNLRGHGAIHVTPFVGRHAMARESRTIPLTLVTLGSARHDALTRVRIYHPATEVRRLGDR